MAGIVPVDDLGFDPSASAEVGQCKLARVRFTLELPVELAQPGFAARELSLVLLPGEMDTRLDGAGIR